MITSSKMVNPPFVRFGCADPRHPLLICVPHSGRDYPPGLALLSRLSVAQLKPLEDRFADLLIEDAVSAGHAALVAHAARFPVDLQPQRTGVRSGSVPSQTGLCRLLLPRFAGVGSRPAQGCFVGVTSGVAGPVPTPPRRGLVRPIAPGIMRSPRCSGPCAKISVWLSFWTSIRCRRFPLRPAVFPRPKS
ncbi:MAG: N-formylglutamate amidohydrolase [Sphingomonadales bacterium]|nr:N-formylglutamate amidohydrolase [Sphingomonadales bacterium]